MGFHAVTAIIMALVFFFAVLSEFLFRQGELKEEQVSQITLPAVILMVCGLVSSITVIFLPQARPNGMNSADPILFFGASAAIFWLKWRYKRALKNNLDSGGVSREGD